MDQGGYVRGTAETSVNIENNDERDDEPAWTRSLDPTIPLFAGFGIKNTRNTTNTSPHTRAANLVGCRGQGISSTAKHPRFDKDFMDILMNKFTTTIEKLRIEVALSMYKVNLLDRQKNQRIKL